MTEDELKRAYGDPLLVPPATDTLYAGPVAVTFTTMGDLRYIRYGKHEIVRRIYATVRAADWWTVPASCVIREKTVATDHFRIVYEAHYFAPQRNIDFRAVVTLTGEPEGRITFGFDGEAFSEFDRKRVGICVLHPASAQGAACTAFHADGTEEVGKLPDTISPHQPFFDIKAFRHAIAPGIEATVEYSGEVFEMEDQRNWLDASFKTYSTPLALPTPVTVPVGERIHQSVTVIPIVPNETASDAWDGATPILPVSSQTLSVIPSVGIRWTEDLHTRHTSLPVPPSGHLWVEVDLAQPKFLAKLQQADADAQRYGLALYVCLKNGRDHLPTPFPSLKSATHWFATGITEDATVSAIKTMIGDHPLSVGFLSNFTELNRQRPDMSYADGVFYCISPQVHATDSLSISETPPTLLDSVRTARAFAAGKSIHIGPVSFGGSNDPRETATFGKEWYQQVLAYAEEADVDSITFAENAIPALQELAMEGTPL